MYSSVLIATGFAAVNSKARGNRLEYLNSPSIFHQPVEEAELPPRANYPLGVVSLLLMHAKCR